MVEVSGEIIAVIYKNETNGYTICDIVTADDEDITVGDSVIVPVGYNNEETEAVVMSVEKCLRINAPYPFYKTKKIIRKI